MFFGLFRLLALISSPLVILGCSTPESQERLDTVLCWLRPSCLPSNPRTPPPLAKPKTSQPIAATTKPKPQQQPQASPQKQLTAPCLTSAKTTVHASKPYATISYMEPSTNAKGQALTNLAKTTIYHDLGEGLVKYKDIPATKPQGGGTVEEKISFSISEGNSMEVTFCVTATNTNGQER